MDCCVLLGGNHFSYNTHNRRLIQKGIHQLSFSFLSKTTPDAFEAMTAVAAGERIPGGIVNGITGTLIMVALAAIIAIPTGLISGIYLYENPGKRLANLIRNVADILQGVPSIVLSHILPLVVRYVTQGFQPWRKCNPINKMLPMIVVTEETLKMIPITIKAAGIGCLYHKVILRVLIPTSFSGLSTGILLGISRIIGETAPLMLTALGSTAINWDITKPTSAIPLLVWEFYNNPYMVDMIWTSSLLLMIIVLSFNLMSKQIGTKESKWKRKHHIGQ